MTKLGAQRFSHPKLLCVEMIAIVILTVHMKASDVAKVAVHRDATYLDLLTLAVGTTVAALSLTR